MREVYLVVGSGGTRAAKRLLPNNGAGWFVVDVEVSGRVRELRKGERCKEVTLQISKIKINKIVMIPSSRDIQLHVGLEQKWSP